MTEKVISLNDWKNKKKEKENLARGRTPLYVSHKEGNISATNPNLRGKHVENFGDRVSKIKGSLERINKLMTELKTMHKKETT